MATKKTTKKVAARRAPAKKTAPKKVAPDAAAAWKPNRPALMLRTCGDERRAHFKPEDGSPRFQWPESGYVEAPDWSKAKACGHGLHGLLWGEGDAGMLCHDKAIFWLVVEIDLDEAVDIDGEKVKAPRGNVLYCGTQAGAGAFLCERAPGKKPHFGLSTSGDGGTSTSGDGGTSTSGDGGTSTSGYRGTSTSGDGGTSTSGYGGTISITYYDAKREKWRVATAEVGENGIEPDTFYVLDAEHRFVKHPTKKHPKQIAREEAAAKAVPPSPEVES
jgi:hypothetical protein